MRAFRPSKLVLGLLAFVVAALAQAALNPASSGYGWILFAVAGILCVLSVGNKPVAQFASGLAEAAPAKAITFSRASRVLIVLALVLTATALVLFRSDATMPVAWYAHLLAVLLYAAAFLLHRPPGNAAAGRPLQFRDRLLEWLPVLGVLGIAAVARLWQLGTFPFGTWADEAVNGMYAAQILRDPHFRPIYIAETRLPAHFIYLIALSFRIFGIGTLAMRLVTTALSLVGVLFAYLLFRRWFGQVVGLAASLLLAVMRYDLTFARFALHGISTPVFELAILYFLDRALANKRISDFAWLGLAMGLALAFYHPLRLMPAVLAVFLLALFVSAIAKYGAREATRRYIRALWRHWVVAALGVLIVVAPIAQFAAQNPGEFFERVNTASIFVRRDQPDLGKALFSNTIKHLQMFNVQGDANGRHNLPGAPMLDSVGGALFVLGIALALWRWRDPTNLLMLLLFSFMLLGGILSLDFEAPQSLRSIGVIPALVYFITLPIAAVARRAREAPKQDKAQVSAGFPGSLSRLRLALWPAAVIAVLVVISYLNFQEFFIRQQNDPAAWGSYSTAETIVANEMVRNAANYDFVVSALYDQSPTVRFLAGSIKNVQRWTVTDRLPLVRQNDGHGMIMLFDGMLLSAYHEATRLYPNAPVIEHHPPSVGTPILYEVIVPPSNLQAVQGVIARYYAGSNLSAQTAKQESLGRMAVDWRNSQPLPAPFVAELKSTLLVPDYGEYRFMLQGDPAASLWIDEYPVTSDPVMLARGLHALRIQIQGEAKTVELWWQPPGAPQAVPVPASNLFVPPVTNTGLRGAYYPSPDWTGPPKIVQLDPQLEYYFHVVPLPRPYSVLWTGRLFAPTAGSYHFALYSIDGSWLTLDGKPVVENPDGDKTVDGTVQLTQGWHDLQVRFSDKTGGTRIYLYWTPPGAQQREIIPTRYLAPPMGQYPASP